MNSLSSASGRRAMLAIAACLAAGLGSARATDVFDVSSFADPPWSLSYYSGFSGNVGITAVWPSEMGWQGDTIDIGFTLPPTVPPEAQEYRFRILVAYRYTQAFELTFSAGSSLASLVQVHSEFVDSPRIVAANIPFETFIPGQTNWIRIQGVGVQVGEGQPSGIQWSRWRLSRLDLADGLDGARLGQLQRLTYYIQNAILANGLVRDSLTLSPQNPPFHPATPDAAGFALLALCAADRLGLWPAAESKAQLILATYAGHTPGVTPLRQPDGHWVHFMNVNNGSYAGGGWDGTYSTIGSALLVAGAQFAKNHFVTNATIAAYADELQDTTNFNLAIHASLNGRVYLGMSASGGPTGGTVVPWNEYMLVVSCALREAINDRALAIAYRWHDPANAPKRAYRGIQTLTDNVNSYAPAFWVHQQHFFNTDFAGNSAFEGYFVNQQRADSVYVTDELGDAYRYGLTAGVDPTGYFADRIANHHNVVSPSAIGGWGDVHTIYELVEDFPLYSDARYRYGLPRMSLTDPTWVPYDAGLVDHLFLMFGLVENIDPLFFKQRQAFQVDDDGDGLATAYDNCPYTWNRRQDDWNSDGLGDACDCGAVFADADHDGDADVADFAVVQTCPKIGDPTAEACYCFDRNGDRAITGADLADLLQCLASGGPDLSPTCGG